MKIGICLHGAMAKIDGFAFFNAGDLYRPGQYVNFRACANATFRHLIHANPSHQFDFFIHSWNLDLEQELVSLYQPVKWLFENNAPYYPEINQKIREPKEFTGASRALSIKKVVELMESEQKQYDFVLIYRPDVLLLKDLILPNYDFNQIYIHNNLPGDPKSDFTFMMNTHLASQFKLLYDYIQQGNPVKHHFWIENYIQNFMQQKLYPDQIFAGQDIEVLRKINFTMVKTGRVKMEKFLEYGLTLEEIDKYNYP